jgi:hypothetical protein
MELGPSQHGRRAVAWHFGHEWAVAAQANGRAAVTNVSGASGP